MNAIPVWLRGSVMLALTAMAWGGMFPVMKPLLTEIDPYTITLVRFGLASPIVLAILLFKEGPRALATEGKWFRLWWLGTLAFAGFGILLPIGLNQTVPEHAAVIPALMPLIAIVVGAVRWRTRPKARALAAVALGLIGVILVVTRGDPAMLIHGGAGQGEGLVLIGATCWVLYTLGALDFPGWSGLRYTTLTLLLGSLSVLIIEILALLIGLIPPPDMYSVLNAAGSFIYLVLFASVMGFLFWNAGIQMLGPTRGVLFINLVPVTAFVVATLNGHIPTGWEITGVVLVVAALVLNSLASRPTPAAGNSKQA